MGKTNEESVEKIIRYANIANEAWDKLEADKKEALIKYFHLRPTTDGVTVITTLPFASMRGKSRLKTAKEISKLLEIIYKNIDRITAVDEDKAAKYIKDEIGLKERFKKCEERLEEDIQAIMINSMNNDLNLARALNSIEKIKFIASEFRFKKGPYRVDIVGFNGKELYLFELKKNRTTKVEQVKKYIDYYSQPTQLKHLKEILQIYPINPVTEFESIKGVMVMSYAEGSLHNPIWKEKAKTCDVSILFYKESLSFIKVA